MAGYKQNSSFGFGGYGSKEAQEAAIAAGLPPIRDQSVPLATAFQSSAPSTSQNYLNDFSSTMSNLRVNPNSYNSDAGYSNTALDLAKAKQFDLKTNQFNLRQQDRNYLDKGYESAAYGEGGRNAYETAINAPGATPEATWQDKYLNADFLGGAGSVLKGFGSLASGWAAMKNLKLTKEAMDTQQNQWQTNFDAQALATNNQISNQNAWKKAQGRTDYGSYVGGKPSGTTYVG